MVASSVPEVEKMVVSKDHSSQKTGEATIPEKFLKGRKALLWETPLAQLGFGGLLLDVTYIDVLL